MGISTFEGVVKNGQIRLRDNVTLPENAQVVVVVSDFEPAPQAHVRTPHLRHREQTADFAKQVVEAVDDAEL